MGQVLEAEEPSWLWKLADVEHSEFANHGVNRFSSGSPASPESPYSPDSLGSPFVPLLVRYGEEQYLQSGEENQRNQVASRGMSRYSTSKLVNQGASDQDRTSCMIEFSKADLRSGEGSGSPRLDCLTCFCGVHRPSFFSSAYDFLHIFTVQLNTRDL